MDWLTEQYRRVQEQKIKQEKTIQLLKQLYKPWPALQKEPDKTGQEKSSSQSTDAAKSSQSQNASGAGLTAEERESLQLMDQLLSKAQRARNIQKKLDEPRKPRTKEVGQSVSKIDTVTKDLKNTSTTNKTKESEKEIAKSNTQSSMKSEVTNKNVPSAKAMNKVKPLNSGVARSGAKTIEKAERARISQRPQSSSSQKKVVPVHASAPFQTNPNLTSAKLQTTYRAATAKTSAKSRGASASVESRVYGRKGTSKMESGKSSSGDSKSCKGDEKKRSKMDSPRSVQSQFISDTLKSKEISAQGEERISDSCEKEGSSLPVNLQAMTIDDHSAQNTDGSGQDVENLHCEKRFDLKKDGATLSVPNKLKKLVYQNRKLRQKLYTQNVTQKVNSPQTCSEFPGHLQHTFGDEEAQETQLQAKQAQHIVQTYTSLSQMLEGLHLDHISANSDPADIYYCKKMVEFILLSFQEMEQLLHTTDFSNLKSATIHSGCPVPKLPVTESSSMSVWYHKNSSTDCAHPVPVYQYHSYKQLETYMNLVFQVQSLQLQIDVMDTVARLLFPLLHTLNPSTREFAQVLRTSYSLLSVNPNHMPVVVKDTIQEEPVVYEQNNEIT